MAPSAKKLSSKIVPPETERPAFHRKGVNEAGYECPRFNLESRKLSWLKNLRSASSRVAANAVMISDTWRTAYENFAGPERVLISMYQVEIGDLDQALSGLRLVQLTDIHHGPWLPIEFVYDIVQRVNSLKPDIVALTGDYVVNSPRYIRPVADALSGLEPSIATIAVLGNHDWWEGGTAVTTALIDHGIIMLDNHRIILTPERELTDDHPTGLCLAGIGDPWTDRVDFDAALAGLPEDIPRLVLSHNPDTAEDRNLREKRYRIDLMISGHTHGGQVCFPNNRKPVLPKIRKNKYSRGLVFGPQCPVYVSRGIGTAGVPLRLGADPEIAVFDLITANSPLPFVVAGPQGPSLQNNQTGPPDPSENPS